MPLKSSLIPNGGGGGGFTVMVCIIMLATAAFQQVQAMAYPGPIATAASHVLRHIDMNMGMDTDMDMGVRQRHQQQQQRSPQPTSPPVIAGGLDLQRRQNSNLQQTVLIAPDNTCGYVSAQSAASYTCPLTAICVFVTASDAVVGSYGAVGCCNSQDCGFQVRCLDLQDVSSGRCTGGCEQDTLTKKCTASNAAFCNTVSFANGATDYFCGSQSASSVQLAETTFQGQTGRTLTQTVLTDSVPISRPTTTSSSSPTSTPPPAASSSSTPIGAIVGGVVGGVAVLGLLGLGAFYLHRQRKNKTTKFSPVPLQPPPAETTQLGNIGGGGGGGLSGPPSPYFTPDPSAAGAVPGTPGTPGIGAKPGHHSMVSNYSGYSSATGPGGPVSPPLQPPGMGPGGYLVPPGAGMAGGGGGQSSHYHPSAAAAHPGHPGGGFGQPVIYEAEGRPVEGHPGVGHGSGPLSPQEMEGVGRHELQ